MRKLTRVSSRTTRLLGVSS